MKETEINKINDKNENNSIYEIEDINEEMIKNIISNIGRKGFCSEADFQFSLAWKLKEHINNENIKIRLEYLFNKQEEDENDKYIDILLIQGNKWLPIELKFRKKETTIKEYDGETYDLKTHGAKDCGCYNYLYDIKRIEEIRRHKQNNFIRGFTIMITNDQSYLRKPRKNASYTNFSIHIGRNLKEIIDEYGNKKHKNKVKLDWINKSKDPKNKKWFETNNHYKKVIEIDEYKIQWLNFPKCKEVDNEKQIDNKISDKFYLLINEIKGE